MSRRSMPHPSFIADGEDDGNGGNVVVADLESLVSADQMRVTQAVYDEMEKMPPFRPALEICGCLNSAKFAKAYKLIQFLAGLLAIILYFVLLAVILPNIKSVYNIFNNIDVIGKYVAGMIQGAALGAAGMLK